MSFVKKIIRKIIGKLKGNKSKVNLTAKIYTLENGNSLANKTVLITGGGRGLGYSMAEKCIKEGAKVLIVGRNEETLKTAALKLGNRCKWIVSDVSKANRAEVLIKQAFDVYPDINCLICNAGVSLHEPNILAVTEEGFEQQFDTNIKGGYFLAQAFLAKRNVDEQNNIIFITSERGFQCDDVPYGLTKAALNSLVRGISRRFYREGVRCNGVAPGITASDMTGRKADGNLYNDGLASGRYFLPEEVAEVTAFLLSDASKCISGEIISCDAGQYLSSYIV